MRKAGFFFSQKNLGGFASSREKKATRPLPGEKRLTRRREDAKGASRKRGLNTESWVFLLSQKPWRLRAFA
jgi:hypothetical protein